MVALEDQLRQLYIGVNGYFVEVILPAEVSAEYTNLAPVTLPQSIGSPLAFSNQCFSDDIHLEQKQ